MDEMFDWTRSTDRSGGEGCIVNATVVTEGVLLREHSIAWTNGFICSIEASQSNDWRSNANTIDARGMYVLPGYIDLQVNGAAGVLFSKSLDAWHLSRICKACLHAGSTTIFPTLISPTLAAARDAISLLQGGGPFSQVVGGLHIEGPFFDHSKAGIHNSSRFCTFDSSWMEMLQDFGTDLPIILTAHPDSIPREFIPMLSEIGVRLLIGHSNASYERAALALSDGFIGFTHLFNAMSQLQGRYPGVVGAALLEDCYSTIIADGFHVDFKAIAIAKRCIGERLALVSDCMPPALGGDNVFQLGPYRVTRSDGRLVSDAGDLAGSSIAMCDAVKNCVDFVGIDLCEAVSMASSVPAEISGLRDRGRLKVGARADLNIVSEDLAVQQTFKHGLAVSGQRIS